MAYGSGNVITAADYNAIADDVNEVYGDTNNGSVIESSASFGYGQTETALPISIGNVITAAQWTALFQSIQSCATHQGTTTGIIPALVTSGTIITAFNGVGGLLDITNSIRNNKLLVAAGQTTTTSNGTRLQSVRSTSWTNTLVHEFTADFGTYNAARYFFNSGGQLRFSASRTGGAANVQNTNWSNTLGTKWGVVTFDLSNTFGSSSGTPSGIGFYNLTGAYQTIYTITGSGYYGDVVSLEARMDGGLGGSSAVRFRWSMLSEPGPDAITGTITTYIDDRRATGSAVSIPAPTYSTLTSLTAGT